MDIYTMQERTIELRFRDRLSLNIQRFIGWSTFPFWGTLLIWLMRVYGRYRIPHLPEIRKRYREFVRTTKGPVLVCANHLTLIDSAIINWSLSSLWSYMPSYKTFPWNMPDRKLSHGNIIFRLLCYLGSCIPVDRLGDRGDVKNSLDKVTYVMKKGHAVTIFPEGTRSRSGRIDPENFSYGVGRLVKMVKDCQVLCVYLRGYKQEKYGSIPKRGDRFYFDMALIKPESSFAGLRATRDIASQIIGQLFQMEQAYFAARGQ